MKFRQSYTFRRRALGTDRQVTVEAELLNIWWGAYVGSQTAEGLVQAHLRTIDDMIRHQILEGIASAESSHFTLTAADWEDDEPFDEGEFKLLGPLH